MRRAGRNRHRIQFSSRSHPRTGIISLCLGVICVGLVIVLCIVSGNERGSSGVWIGVAGIWTFFLSIAGFVLATKSYRLDDIYMITPTLGSVLNGIVIVLMMFLYVAGAVR